jgi:hypothetical protein
MGQTKIEKKKKKKISVVKGQEYWQITKIPALGRLRQENHSQISVEYVSKKTQDPLLCF